MAEQAKGKSKKGAPKSAGRRRSKIATYYELTYPERKLRRMFRHGSRPGQLRTWADNYKCPSGASGIHALVKLSKQLKIQL